MISSDFDFVIANNLLKSELARLEEKKKNDPDEDKGYIAILENQIKRELNIINKISTCGVHSSLSVEDFNSQLEEKTNVVLLTDSQYVQFIKTSSLYKSMVELVKNFEE